MSPMLNTGNLPRQTDEVSRSAELRLQTEPDSENPAVTPNSAQASGVNDGVQTWWAATTRAVLSAMPNATRVAAKVLLILRYKAQEQM
ncbi:hypothetical protein [Nonomuraea sp. NPDC002799]